MNCRLSSLVFHRIGRATLAGLLLAAACAVRAAAPGASEARGTDHLQSRLVARTDAVAPGRPLQLGLLLEHAPQWHTYWKNPGDSGLPTRIDLALPAGVTAGPIEWPLPERLPYGELVNFGYHGTVLLPLTVQVPAGYAARELRVQAHAQWLICREECIPGEADYTLVLPVADAGRPPREIEAWREHFARAAARQPQPAGAGVKLSHAVEGKDIVLRFTGPGLPAGLAAGWTVFPAAEQVISNAAVPRWTREGAGWTARIAHGEYFSKAPERMEVVLTHGERALTVESVLRGPATVAGEASGGAASAEKGGGGTGVPAGNAGAPEAAATSAGVGNVPGGTGAGSALDGAVAAASPGGTAGSAGTGATAAASSASSVASAISPSAPAETPGLAAALVLAFAGGLVLNLMPCVFPVLFLKASGALAAADDRAALRRHGLLYAAGVVASFLAVAGVLLALRSSGEALGWGFQLQEPRFVAAMAALMFVLGLSFAGMIEIGARLAGLGEHLTRGHDNRSAFFTGVLACVVASPCTAPFMGSALGFALTQPAAIALAVFAALALGMAAPMLALGFVPGLARVLPRPGPWMATLRQLLAFPLFLTVVWLVWVYGEQTSPLAMALLLAALVGVAFAAWLFGHAYTARTRTRAWAACAGALAALAVALVLPFMQEDAGARASTPAGATDGIASTAVGPAGIAGLAAAGPTAAEPMAPDAPLAGSAPQAWSAARLAALRAAGRPVLVNMTAAWCITCLVNERVAFSTAEVQAAFAAHDLAYLVGDWTRRDAAITHYLESFGRSGVPLYVLYPPGGRAPVVLPQVLTPGIVRAALDAL